jgi:hypothetical protein
VSIDILGVLTIIAGAFCLISDASLAIYVFMISTLLEAAAAVTLTALGSANLSPAHLLLGFLTLGLLLHKRQPTFSLGSLAFPRDGFWLLLCVAYGVGATMIMPRLFQGMTDVFAISRSDFGGRMILAPLAPVSGNVTQTIYFVGDFACFVIFYGYARDGQKVKTLCHAGIACALANLAFGALDLATYWTDTADWLTFLRNASYRMLDDVEISGFKRIVGSFPEASSYAYATLGLFAFTGKLWLRGIYPRLTGTIAGLSLVALCFSTSSTAYVGLSILLAMEYVGSLAQILNGRCTRATIGFIGLAPAVASIVLMGLALRESTWSVVQDLANKTVFDKLSSASGVERGAWNAQAIINLVDTAGFGTGIGSMRASSFLLAVPANIGIFGALTYAVFLLRVLLKATPADVDWFAASTRAAAQSACLALLIGSSVAGSFVDLGLPFFIFAGMASGIAGHDDRYAYRRPAWREAHAPS